MASVSSDPLLISMRSQGAREQNSRTTAVCNSDVIIPDVEKQEYEFSCGVFLLYLYH